MSQYPPHPARLLRNAADGLPKDRWEQVASVNCGDVYVKHGTKGHSLCPTEALAKFIALCDPQTIIGLLDEVERLEKNQRTAGTKEICTWCKQDYATMHPDDKARCPGVCARHGEVSNCPIRSAQQQAQEAT